ncbi:ABC transporter permease [Haloferacaceae archaeon DSL9]
MTDLTTLRTRLGALGYREGVALGTGFVLAAIAIFGLLFPESPAGDLFSIVYSRSTVAHALRLSVPIVLAAIGGIFAEKCGVINIGLEGLLIISAFTAVLMTVMLGPNESTLFVPNIWLGFLFGVLASVLLAGLFGIVCIEFKADQIIAGLAVWLVALGLAPFGAQAYFGSRNTGSIHETVGYWPVLIMLLSVAGAWFVLNHTAFGRYVRAAGENPKALDTVGVSVRRIRHSGVLLSGVFAGMGGASLSLMIGLFTGTGETMVEGRGFIAIVVYLFGNYNPIGAFGASFLFATLEAMQVRLQQLGYGIPTQLVETIPYLVVILVLAFVGRTRIPKAAGEHYESEE